jgi:hypothetical protein
MSRFQSIGKPWLVTKVTTYFHEIKCSIYILTLTVIEIEIDFIIVFLQRRCDVSRATAGKDFLGNKTLQEF